MTGWVSKEGSEGMPKGYKKESHTSGVVVKKASRRKREKRLLLSPDKWAELKVEMKPRQWFSRVEGLELERSRKRLQK